MSLIVRRCNWLMILLVAVGTGCRMGSPLDRNVQISQHLGGEDSPEPPPRTRLASSSASPLPASAEPTRHSLDDGDPAAASASSQPRVAAQRQASALTAERADAANALTATSVEADIDSDVDFSELIAAFRDSPPEVQQQAIRQLIAAASHRASKTEQPMDISEQLERSLSALPILPDDLEETDSLPIRLAATSTAAPAEQATDAGVSQAIAASDSQPAVAPASSLMPAPTAVASSLPESSAAGENKPRVSDQAFSPERGEKDKLETAGDAALYDELVARLRSPQAGESDGDRFRREIIKRYLQVLAGDPDSAVQTLEGLTAPEQEFLRHHLLALWNMTDADGHPVTSRRFAAALPQVRLATRHLSEATEQLEVRSLAFCTEILSFGQVKRFISNRFEVGQKVILYCEIDNFVAEKTSEGYETELQGSYEIFDANGTKVAGQVLPADRQVCDHYLRDYFIAYQMHLPSHLEAGDYRLELSMQCVKGHKYGQATLPLVIKK